MLTNEYAKKVYAIAEKRNPNEPEFLQAVYEVLLSLEPVLEANPVYEKYGVFTRRELEARYGARSSSEFPGSTTRDRSRSTAATESSSTRLSDPTREASGSTRPSTFR